MKKIIISYAVFTLLWIAFLFFFSEDNMPLPVVVRIVSLYIWIIITVVYLIIAIVHLAKRKNAKLSYGVLILVLLNVFVMTMNPFNLVTGFFG